MKWRLIAILTLTIPIVLVLALFATNYIATKVKATQFCRVNVPKLMGVPSSKIHIVRVFPSGTLIQRYTSSSFWNVYFTVDGKSNYPIWAEFDETGMGTFSDLSIPRS